MQCLINFFDPKHYGKFSDEEIPKKVKDYISFPLKVFKITFVIFTLFFLINIKIQSFGIPDWLIMILFIEATILLMLSAFHVLLGITFIIFAIADRDHAPLIAKKFSVVLLNIPIGALYIYILKSVFLQS